MERNEHIRRIERHERMVRAVLEQFMQCSDETIIKYFDINSEDNLQKKLMVLKAVNAGEDVDEKDYIEILELIPKDENGAPLVDDT